jgi:hypothetical protein
LQPFARIAACRVNARAKIAIASAAKSLRCAR